MQTQNLVCEGGPTPPPDFESANTLNRTETTSSPDGCGKASNNAISPAISKAEFQSKHMKDVPSLARFLALSTLNINSTSPRK
ncbi:hypothetical protein PsYK624_046760 [Phanerochaete sordida]|uniref:Uncharacterized protein n=1 Tax=Phanerochaete sordida TaxID=48140 RepID=A0A9P3G3S5_9APHY|nr:hypothetical protein PsYK624_046760 [Phanerochaete sordida]